MADEPNNDPNAVSDREDLIEFLTDRFALPANASDEDVVALVQGILVQAQDGAVADNAGDAATSVGARTVRVDVHGQKYDVTLTRRQLASKSVRRIGAARHAVAVARLFGPMPNSEKYGVKLVRG